MKRRPRQSLSMPVALLIVAGALIGSQASADVLSDLLDGGPRFIGSPGHERAAAIIEQQLRVLPAGRVVVHRMQQVVPVVDHATLTMADGSVFDVHPMWPNGAAVCATPEEGIDATLTYVGAGQETELSNLSLDGAIAAMEYNSYDRWKLVMALGARAVLFLPPDDTTWVQSHAKFADLTAHAPRFYLNDARLADAIRRDRSLPSVRLTSAVRWSVRPVRNFLMVFPGNDEQLADQTVILAARYDASGVVPGLAHGAEQAISPAVLVQVAVDLAATPPARTTVLIWSGADGLNFASLRAVLSYAGIDDAELEKQLTDLSTKIDSLRRQAESIQRDARDAIDRSSDVRDQFARQVRYRLVDVRKRLARSRSQDVVETGVVALQEDESSLNRLLVDLQLQSVDSGFEPLTPAVLGQIQAELNEAEDRRSYLEQDVRSIRALLDRDHVVALLSLDLSSGGPEFGLYWKTAWQANDQFAVLSRLGRSLVDHGSNPLRGFLGDTMDGRRDGTSDICCPLPTAADVAVHFGYLALSMVTAYDGRWLVDSPLDQAEKLNRDNIDRQVPAVIEIVRRAVTSPTFRMPNRFKVDVSNIDGQAVVPSPGDSRLNLGQANRLVTINTLRPIPRAVGTRWLSVQFTSSTGRYIFEGLSESRAGNAVYTVDVLGLDSRGRVVEAANHFQGLQQYRFSSPLNLDGAVKGVKSVMFDCRSQTIAGLRDPRYVQDLPQLRPLVQRTGDEPRFYAVRASDGLASLVMRPQRRWMLLMSKGARGVRMLMLGSDPQHPLGAGYDFDQPVRFALAAGAHDFLSLNQSRLDVFARYGITGAMADRLQVQSRERLGQADLAEASGDVAAQMTHLRAALAMQQVVYRHVMETGDDVVMAVVFLLVVLLPFSFYVERLFINAVTIYGRIGGFVGVFVAMLGLLTVFHPAFRISMTPVVVLLAFVIIVLSSLVVFILFLRFTEQFKRGSAMEHTASLSRLSVMTQSMLVGIVNMRRRKIRTAFTLVTLVVMTFTLLSLSGTRTELKQKQFGIGVRPNYPGVLVAQVGWKPMPAWFLEHLQGAYGRRARVGGQFWLTQDTTTTFKPLIIAQRASRKYFMSALMGVSENEHLFHQADPQIRKMLEVLGASPDGCLLPSEAARTLGAGPGDEVRLHGRSFRVVGVFDEQSLSRLQYLSGQAFGPIDLQAETRRSRQTAQQPQTEEQMLEPAHLEAARAYRTLSPRYFAVIHADTARQMGASLRSICMRADDPQVLEQIGEELSTNLLVPVYRSAGDDVQLIAARAQLGFIGFGDLVIPLLIGALIIMNTMINAVADQRSNIHIYTSLGLAPIHVGVLFLSEAAALGTMGVVGGFILGQGFTSATNALGLLDAVTLNYSSTAVVLTMAMVMVIVLLSAIYPAMMAGRLAVPGEAGRWELPAPRDDRLHMDLPFTVGETTARGACAFLHEWLDLHRESGVGVFISDQVKVFHRQEDRVRGVESKVWLAPFDVGVSQQVTISITPAEQSFYLVTVQMHRQSGQETAWLRANRAFVNEMRKQLLLWRNLSSARQQQYVELSQQLLEGTSLLPSGGE